jgi:5'-nucleotidase
MNKRLRILLTNDDGFDSPGIRRLYGVLSRKHDVVVSAPQKEQSGIGHAFTFNRPLSYSALPSGLGMQGWAVAGTPSDCVKFAVSYLLPPNVPDVVISGMNIGENSGISGYYSGTVAAAREGAFWHLPSFAFSLCERSTDDNDYLDAYCVKAAGILDRILATGPVNNGRVVFYNINFPSCIPAECKGIKVTRQSLAFFDDRYKKIMTPGLPDGFVVYGEKKDVEKLDTFDSRALMNRYIAVTPLCFDATAEWALPCLSSLEDTGAPDTKEQIFA